MQVELSGQIGYRCVGAFYSPQGNLYIGGVRDLNMSRLGAGHVRQHSLEPGLHTGYEQCVD
jgi:hypothetical protein